MPKTTSTFKTIAMLAIITLIAISYVVIVGGQLDKAGLSHIISNSSANSSVAGLVDKPRDIANDSSNDEIILANMNTNRNLSYNLPSKPVYILRLDDVQVPTWSDISMQIVNDTLSRNMSISIGVIPTRTDNDPCGLTAFIREHEKDPHFEVVQHGSSHTYYEYDNISTNETQLLTMKGLRSLYQDYSVCPVTFIPPNNEISSYNNSTANILYDMGFRILSTEGDMRYEGGILNVGSNVATNGRTRNITNVEEMVKWCKQDFDEQNLSVIMIHPQDFVTDDRRTLDPAKYANYLELLDELNKTGAQSITFRDLLVEQ